MFLEDISGGRQVIRSAGLCFTDEGQQNAGRIEGLTIYRFGKDFTDTRQMTGQLMRGNSRTAALLFFSSAGIAVRMTAPYIADKMTDPAVIVINDTADFVIPLLSGHAGRANELAVSLSEQLNAQPVITTASDHRKHLESPDLWAVREGYAIAGRNEARRLTAAMVAGKKAEKIRTGDRVIWKVQGGGKDGDDLEVEMFPRKYVLGIGCRRGTSFRKMERFVSRGLEKAGIRKEDLFKICSIDMKSEEPCFLDLSAALRRPFVVFSAEQLNQTGGVFTGSGFVQKITGTDNVCERSALAGCQPWRGKLLIRKTAEDGMTLAVAERVLF